MAPNTITTRIPRHVETQWRFFNALIDQVLAADLKPWSIAETACAAISSEWRTEEVA